MTFWNTCTGWASSILKLLLNSFLLRQLWCELKRRCCCPSEIDEQGKWNWPTSGSGTTTSPLQTIQSCLRRFACVGRRSRDEVWARKYQRELATIAMQNSHAEELMNLNLYQLLNTFNKVIKRFDDEKHKVHHKIVQYPYTISEQKVMIRQMIAAREITFAEVILACQNKVQAILHFSESWNYSRNKFSALRLVLASTISG